MNSFLTEVLLLIYLTLQVANISLLNISIPKVGRIRNNSTGRIVHGKPAKYGQFPFMASVRGVDSDEAMYYYSCGGSLISSSWVVTAAHCVKNQIYWIVRVGSIYQDDLESDDSIEVRSYEGIMHPNFSLCDEDAIHDIGLIKLPKQVIFTKNIKPVRLPKVSDLSNRFTNIKVRLCGWGRIRIDKSQPYNLQYADFVTITNEECQKTYRCAIQSVQCAVGRKTNACLGDSGGPYTRKEADLKTTLIGISSFGDEFCSPGIPNAYTRTVYYLDWIHKITKIPLRL